MSTLILPPIPPTASGPAASGALEDAAHRAASVTLPPLPPRPLLLLAPMEGVMDAPLRELLTRVGGMDRCVSEFIRITDRVLPERVFRRMLPELAQGSRTSAGVPVRAQLLGSDPACLADNAARLAEMGAEGIDLNFGCPTKVVNRHRGGAVLLKEPEQMHAIVRAVRAAVPAPLPVSAKMRLGYDDTQAAADCARALAEGGAAEIVVHARTRADGYRPPAHWHLLPLVREAVQAQGVPVIANGEIWTVADALRCRAESGCSGLMLGRGAVADPGLALAIRAADAGRPGGGLDWPAVRALVDEFWTLSAALFEPRQRAGRLKQWLHLLARRHPEGQALYEQVRPLGDARGVDDVLGEAGVDRVAGAMAAALPAGPGVLHPVGPT